MQLKDGSLLQSGKYRILRVLGQGGFGITYLAEHTLLEKKVAIKEFFPKQFCDRDQTTSHVTVGTQSNQELMAKLKSRFLKEARNISKLRHPGIISIHDIFEENNSAYYVMDFIEGESLSEIVKREGAMDEARAVGFIRKVGEALEYIHSHKMTHFDVKPANIMVRKEDDYPILIDFGLSKQYNDAGEATTTGMTGVSRGFSAIELTNLSELVTFSEQSDVYSLGATLLYLLTGTIPPDASVLVSGSEDLEIPPNISSCTANAIKSAMEINRRTRTQNVRVFLNQIDDCYDSSESDKHQTTTKALNNPSFDANNLLKKSDESTVILGKKDEKESVVNSSVSNNSINFGQGASPSKNIRSLIVITAIAVVIGIIISVWASNKSSNDTEVEFIDSVNSIENVEDYTSEASEELSADEMEATVENTEQLTPIKKKSEDATVEKQGLLTPIIRESDNDNKTSQEAIHQLQSNMVKNGSYSFGYASYYGELKNGKPNGKGKLTFTSSHNDNLRGYSADAGDFINGYFSNGNLDHGTLYKNDGTKIKSIY